MRLSGTRLAHHPSRAGLTREVNGNHVWTGEVRLNEGWIDQPLRWRRPRRIFVCAHGDLFHPAVPDEWIDQVFAVMSAVEKHTFQILTKRPDRMRRYIASMACGVDRIERYSPFATLDLEPNDMPWPLPNVWLGVSVEDQARADERIPILLETPAAVRWISAEPLLGPVDLTRLDFERDRGWCEPMNSLRPYTLDEARNDWGEDCTQRTDRPGLDWVVVGGESGPGARPCWVPNVRTLVRQCRAAGVAVHVKQLGADVQDRNDAGFDGCEPKGWPDMDPAKIETDIGPYRDDYQGAPVRIHLRDPKGGDPAEWPLDLCVREWPDA